MLQSLKAYEIISGYRGSEKRDINALAELLVKISNFAVAHKNDLAEMDINPVFLYPEGEGIALADALIVRYE